MAAQFTPSLEFLGGPLSEIGSRRVAHPSNPVRLETKDRSQFPPGVAKSDGKYAQGLFLLKTGRFREAEDYFRGVLEKSLSRKQNPRDKEPFYHLGVALKRLGRTKDAAAAFATAVSKGEWQAVSYLELGELECIAGNYEPALHCLDQCLAAEARNLRARNLKTSLLRMLGRNRESSALAEETIAFDQLRFRSQYELAALLGPRKFLRRIRELLVQTRMDPNPFLDLAYEYGDAGLPGEAARALGYFVELTPTPHPLALYALGFFAEQNGETGEARRYRGLASKARSERCHPRRTVELAVLESAIRANQNDARAHYYMGKLLYFLERRAEAIGHWEYACGIDPAHSTAWRDLGVAYYNELGDIPRALMCYEYALRATPGDIHLQSEFDQIRK